MPTDIFLMDNGCDYRTRLFRTRIVRFGREEFVWRDSGTARDRLEFEDEDGVPVDCFGLPLDGDFVSASIKNC